MRRVTAFCPCPTNDSREGWSQNDRYTRSVSEIHDASDIEGVLSTLDQVVELARAGEHRWGVFAALYREVTRAVANGIEAGRFQDADRMSRFDAEFANYYFEALRRHLAGQEPSTAWRVALRASQRDDLTALQHILLGVNAHINVDLGFAVVSAGLDPVAFRADFLEINAILEEVLTAGQAVLNTFSTALDRLDRWLGNADETLGLFVLGRARDQAWLTAVLANALPLAHRDALVTTVDGAAAHLGRRIADPGMPGSAAVALMRRTEAWTVSQLLAGFDGIHSRG